MANSGSKSVTVTSWDTLKFSWEESSQSVENNTTTISWKMELIATSSGKISSTASKDWSVTVNGTKYSGTNTVGIAANSTKTLASGSTTIKHNTDGTKTFSYSFSQEFGISFSGSSIGTKSGSSTGVLDTIPRASSITVASANIGSRTTIKISRASTSFTHTITYSFKGSSTTALTGTIASKTAASAIAWDVPLSFYTKIPNAKSGTCEITCETFNGSVSVGKKMTAVLITIDEEACKPALNPVVIDTNNVSTTLTGNANTIIKGYNNVSVAINAEAVNSATIKSYKITCGSKSITTSSGSMSNVETGVFKFSATDSRGLTTTQTVTKTLVNYTKVTCNLSATKPTTDGKMSFTIKGNYFKGNFGAKENYLSVQYRIKTNNGAYGEWITVTPTISGTTYATYSVTTNLTGLDYQSSYTIQAKAADAVKIVTSAEKKVKTTPVFDWGENDFRFHVPVHLDNAKQLKGTNSDGSESILVSLNASNQTFFGYGNYDAGVGLTYLDGNDVRIRTKKDIGIYDQPNDSLYSLLGMAKAITNTYTLECTPTAGENYSSVAAQAHLIGNNLRITMSCTRNAAANVGNVTNEIVMTINIKHDGKIDNLYRVDFVSGTEGSVASFDAQASAVDANNYKVTIRLCATTTAVNTWNAYFVMPANIRCRAYV